MRSKFHTVSFLGPLFALLALSMVSTDATASDVRGTRTAHGALAVGERVTVNNLVFEKGALTTIRVNGETDIDCYLYNADDELVGFDTDDASSCLIKIIPAATREFTVSIKNNGSKTTTYDFEAK